MLPMVGHTGLSHERLCITNKQFLVTDKRYFLQVSRWAQGLQLIIIKQFCYKTSSKASETWKFFGMVQEIAEGLVIAQLLASLVTKVTKYNLGTVGIQAVKLPDDDSCQKGQLLCKKTRTTFGNYPFCKEDT
jgi:hypothetical protein